MKLCLQICCLGLLNILVVPGQSQDLLETLRRSRQAYQQFQNYYGTVNTRVYDHHHSDRVIQTRQLTVRRQGPNFEYNLGDRQLLLNTRFKIEVVESEKVLVCHRAREEESLHNPFLPDLKSLVEQFSEINYKGITGQGHCYVLRQAKGPVELMELYFDEVHYLLNKIVYHYTKSASTQLGAARVEMNCRHINLNPQFEPATFSEEKFIQVQGQTIAPQKPYQSYTLILGEGLKQVTQ